MRVKREKIKMVLSILLVFALLLSAPAVMSQAATLSFVDDCGDLSKSAAHSDNMQAFSVHPDTGLSVAGKSNGSAEGWIQYSFEENLIAEFSIDVQIHNDFTDAAIKGKFIVSVQSMDGNWNPVEMTPGARTVISGKETTKFKVSELTLSAPLDGAVQAIKIQLKQNIGYYIMLDRISVTFESSIGPEVEQLTDPFEDTDKMNQLSEYIALTSSHPKTGLSLLGRLGSVGDSWIEYQKTGHTVSDFVLDIQFAPDSQKIDEGLSVLARRINTNIWTEITLHTSEPTDIPGYDETLFKKSTVTPATALPEDIAAIRIRLTNELPWTLMLDELNLTFIKTEANDNPGPPDEEAEHPALDGFNFRDDLKDLSKIAELSDNFQLLEEHPGTHLRVLERTNGAKMGTILYKQTGREIQDFTFKFQIMHGTFVMQNNLQVRVRSGDNGTWEAIPVKLGYAVKENEKFSSAWAEPAGALPEHISEIQVIFAGNAFHNISLQAAYLLFDGESSSSTTSGESNQTDTSAATSTTNAITKDTSDINPIPETGESGHGRFLLVLFLVSGLAVMITGIKRGRASVV